jgi:alpha-N-acetylglucosamine transferase
VEPVYCNHKQNLNPAEYDLNGESYQAGLKRWSATCTKFQAWGLIQYKRVIFMDSDTLVVKPIDDALYGFSNASFVAAPETFPPDNFNSGVMVFSLLMILFGL